MNENTDIGISAAAAKNIKDAIADYLKNYNNHAGSIGAFVKDGLSLYAKGENSKRLCAELGAALTECLNSYGSVFTELGQKMDDVLDQYKKFDTNTENSAIKSATELLKQKVNDKS